MRGSSSCHTVTTEVPEIPSITTGSARLTALTCFPKCRASKRNGVFRSKLEFLSPTGGDE